jgi:hypothetical protein
MAEAFRLRRKTALELVAATGVSRASLLKESRATTAEPLSPFILRSAPNPRITRQRRLKKCARWSRSRRPFRCGLEEAPLPGEGGELLRLHVPQEPSRCSVLREKIPRGSIPACGSPRDRKRRGVILPRGEGLQARDEQGNIVERRFLVLLQVEAEPASGEAAVAIGLLTRDQACQLERLGDRHAADLRRGRLGEHEVVAFERPPENRSRVALRGSTLLLSGTRDGKASLVTLHWRRRRPACRPAFRFSGITARSRGEHDWEPSS